MVIRKAVAEDAEGIYALEQVTFSTPWSREAIDKEFENPVATYWVAEADGEIVGYVGVWCVLEEGQITNVAVHKSHRGQGIGKQLIKALKESMNEAGLEVLLLEVRESNAVAKKLYEGSGFQVLGMRKNYYTKPTEHGLIMGYNI
ncbi:MAG: ribosomal protein S18-alanine N-acetyltransferase [Cellulosilyticaceae bacterium]